MIRSGCLFVQAPSRGLPAMLRPPSRLQSPISNLLSFPVSVSSDSRRRPRSIGEAPPTRRRSLLSVLLDLDSFPWFWGSFSGTMTDWAPVLVGVVLFVLLSPGLLCQLPGNNRQVDFGGMRTNGKAIAVHTLIFFTLYSILILALKLHIYTG